MLQFNTSTEAAQYLNKLKFGLLDVEFAAKYRFLREDGSEITYFPITISARSNSITSHICMIQLENSDRWGIFIENIEFGYDSLTSKYKDSIVNMGRVALILDRIY